MSPLHRLTDGDLDALARGLRAGRLGPSFSPVALCGCVSAAMASPLAAYLGDLANRGWRSDQLAELVGAVLAERAEQPREGDLIELVWTGPETPGTFNRDTGVVVRELFATAEESVVVAGYAVYQGRDLFRGLAEQQARRPGLHIRLYLDIHRGYQDLAPDEEIIRRFARKFVQDDWPDDYPIPEVYFDPRSLATDPAKRSSLHAKCVIVDRRVALVTSANFTEAAQERNIEAGVIVRSPRFAAGLADHFGALAAGGLLRRLDIVR